ncbi:carboxymuconolactone decarboxylase family protein [Paenibacillus sp. BJ-4]|uniref:carboxymuconolactone decarboxylase family protein n=1 Tax=Paenibacillus sp. BJ-4 TaxID=2878097 RepID=UPI001CF04FD5|nr:carboxymuconolactone decarboxylase family protein [Paenibacillus sp. BJ-4]
MKHKLITSSARETLGDFAPAFVSYTEGVLFGDVWRREALSLRERSLITVAALVAGEHVNQLPYHLFLAKQNGISEEELVEVMTQLAFYVGWPRAASAIQVAKDVFCKEKETDA